MCAHGMPSGTKRLRKYAAVIELAPRLLALLEWLRTKLPNLANISAHEVLDRTKVPSSDNPGTLVWRKRDPGPRFPWNEVLDQCGLKFFDPS